MKLIIVLIVLLQAYGPWITYQGPPCYKSRLGSYCATPKAARSDSFVDSWDARMRVYGEVSLCVDEGGSIYCVRKFGWKGWHDSSRLGH